MATAIIMVNGYYYQDKDFANLKHALLIQNIAIATTIAMASKTLANTFDNWRTKSSCKSFVQDLQKEGQCFLMMNYELSSY